MGMRLDQRFAASCESPGSAKVVLPPVDPAHLRTPHEGVVPVDDALRLGRELARAKPQKVGGRQSGASLKRASTRTRTRARIEARTHGRMHVRIMKKTAQKERNVGREGG
eukprot:6184239-Pleurochrysis_carterae.AAC.4